MSWNEEPCKTCPDCRGQGGFTRMSAITKERIATTCTRCSGDGFIAYGDDPGPTDPDGPDTWKEAEGIA